MKNKEDINKLIELFQKYVFSGYYQVDKACILDEIFNLKNKLNISDEFMDDLDYLSTIILKDFNSYLINDPSVRDEREIVFCYPGLYATICYRLAHELTTLKVKLLPRIITEIAHSKTGIDIHPNSEIEEGLFIDHGTGIVIGETAVIGKNVKIYHGVTLGALSLDNPEKLKGMKRHPTIMDNVTIYSNATILGGKTVIGENSIIGCNAIITKSIDNNTRIINKIK